MSDDLSWLKHITKVANEGKQLTWWILRCFTTRSTALLHLFRSFVVSKIEYACPLWLPYMKKDIQKIEALQRCLTAKLDGMDGLNYHDRLKKLNLYSLQRRRERFVIITIWKIANNLHPNQLDLQFYNTPRFGLKCRRKTLKTSTRAHINTLYHNSFPSVGPALFNTLPMALKSKSTLISFKASLDKYLETIPDLPPIPGYPIINGNSLLEWVGQGMPSERSMDSVSAVTAVPIALNGDATLLDKSCTC